MRNENKRLISKCIHLVLIFALYLYIGNDVAYALENEGNDLLNGFEREIVRRLLVIAGLLTVGVIISTVGPITFSSPFLDPVFNPINN